VLLTVALGLAMWRLPHFRQARFLVLLSPLVEQRNFIVHNPSGILNGLPEVGTQRDALLKDTVKAYPGLIDRFRRLHPEIKNDFRDTTVGLMEMELSYMNSDIQFRNARSSIVALAEKSCPVDNPFSTLTIFDKGYRVPPRFRQQSHRQVRGTRCAVTAREFEDAKVKLTEAAGNLRDKLIKLEDGYSKMFVGKEDLPVGLQPMAYLDISALKNVEDWTKNPDTNCVKQARLDLPSLERRLYGFDPEETRLPCVCRKDGP
jgi:hypothetical protein